MYMGKALSRLIQYCLVGYFVLTIFEGITLPTSYIYLTATFILFAMAIFLSSAILNFLTIKENFITAFLMTTILCIGVFFFMEAFMTGFEIETYQFEGINTGNLVIHPFEVTKVLTMVFGSLLYSSVTSILNVLDKS